jgi:hypothetical protein
MGNRVAGRGSDGQRSCRRIEFEAETFAVDDGFVVTGAQQDEIGEVGAAAVEPLHDVMSVEFAAPGARRIAATFAIHRAEQIT